MITAADLAPIKINRAIFHDVPNRPRKFVKGGEKPDRRGGVKLDHLLRREGLDLVWICRGSWSGGLRRLFFGGAFRPERKLPLQIAATCRVELILDLGSTRRLGGSVPFAFF